MLHEDLNIDDVIIYKEICYYPPLQNLFKDDLTLNKSYTVINKIRKTDNYPYVLITIVSDKNKQLRFNIGSNLSNCFELSIAYTRQKKTSKIKCYSIILKWTNL